MLDICTNQPTSLTDSCIKSSTVVPPYPLLQSLVLVEKLAYIIFSYCGCNVSVDGTLALAVGVEEVGFDKGVCTDTTVCIYRQMISCY